MRLPPPRIWLARSGARHLLTVFFPKGSATPLRGCCPHSSSGTGLHRSYFLHHGQQRAQPGFHVAPEFQAHGTAVALGERLIITQRLRVFEQAEGKSLAGDLEVAGRVRGNLQEYSVVGATFVELPCGVQEARAVSGGGGYLPAIADGEADLLDECLVGR